jgi:hypothetical protein
MANSMPVYKEAQRLIELLCWCIQELITWERVEPGVSETKLVSQPANIRTITYAKCLKLSQNSFYKLYRVPAAATSA